MKKTNFLKSVAALVLGCMFTSCEKEELNATFIPEGAEITIKAEAFDGLTGKKIDNAQFVADKFQDAINTTKKMEPGQSIAATTVTIKAVYNGAESAPVELKIKDLKSGGKAEYNVTLIISDEFIELLFGFRRVDHTLRNLYKLGSGNIGKEEYRGCRLLCRC